MENLTYTGGEYSPEDLLHELKERVKNENVRTYESYCDLVDELIEEKKGYGFFSEEEDLIQLEDDLKARWPEIENKLEQ